MVAVLCGCARPSFERSVRRSDEVTGRKEQRDESEVVGGFHMEAVAFARRETEVTTRTVDWSVDVLSKRKEAIIKSFGRNGRNK